MKRQFSTALALSLVAAIQLGAADLYVASGALETASCTSVEEACDFQTALWKVRDNEQTNTIHVTSGTYNISSPLSVDFWYGEDKALTIQRLGESPVILDGRNSSSIMTIDAGYDNYDIGITIRGLTFLNGNGSLGGLFVDIGNKNITIEDSNFSGNTGGYGGGIYFWVAGSATLTNNTFSNNISSEDGGGASIVADVATLTNNIFSRNSAEENGGGVSVKADTVTLTNNTFSHNSSDRWWGGGVSASTGGTITLTNNTFIDNSSARGGGVATSSSDDGNITLTSNTFIGNNASIYGGGVEAISGYGTVTLTNNSFSGNSANSAGGGALAYSLHKTVTLTNNTFSGNSSDVGGGGVWALSDEGTVTMTNNTFSGNSASEKGGGVEVNLYSDSAKAEIYNNIIRNNTAYAGGNDGNDLFIWSNGDKEGIASTVLLRNNDLGDDANFTSGQSEDLYITDTDNYTQASNLKEDPLFVDADNGDFHLSESSPLIDMGNDSAPALPEKDFEGDKRVIDGNSDGDALPDIGADEYNPPEKQAEDIIEFIESGVLVGTGPGKSGDKRIDALNNKIGEAKQMIEDEDIDGACDQLQSTLQLTDGDTTPPDWVEGDTAVDLANMIQDLMDSIDCSI